MSQHMGRKAASLAGGKRRWDTGRIQPRHGILVLAAVIIAAFAALLVSGSLIERERAMAEAYRTTQNLARILEQHASQTFARVDEVLLDLDDALKFR
ncbi:MAG: hypothetical protein JO255_19875, partial [Alphaproteobacteria bacterium]|nr:hypothetical protein [Alphaproteobacteria bacterium]